MKVQELLKNPNSWTKHSWSLNTRGESCSVSDIDACKWCIVGALLKCYYYNHAAYQAAYDRLYKVIGNTSLFQWNDDKSRTHKEVLEVCIKAAV